MNIFKNYSKIWLYIFIFIMVLSRIILWNESLKDDYATILYSSSEKAYNFTLKVTSMPKETDDGLSFNAKILSESKLKNKLLVQLKHAKTLDISYGDVISLGGFLSIPESGMNHGNFNHRDYLKSQGVSGILKSDIVRIKTIESSNLKSFYSVRSKVSKQFFRYLPYEEASLVNALITGSKDELTQNTEKAFKRAGVYHIVAVSGLHLNMFILFLSYLYKRIPVKKRKRRIIIIVSNLFAVIFMLMFTGFGVSVKRAAIMAIILTVAPFAEREYSSVQALFVAMFLILLKEPFAYTDVGFLLSFLSTFGIILAITVIRKYEINKKRFSLVYESIIISVFTWILTFPVTVSAFHEVSLITPLSNLIILLLMPMLLTFAYVFAIICVIFSPAVIKIAALFMIVPSKAIIFISEILSSFPISYMPMSEKGALIVISEIILLATVVISFIKKNKRTACIIMSLITIANFSFLMYNKSNDEYQVHFINVGQGECSIIRTPGGRNILIDCGSESREDVYENNVLPYMNYENINKIDLAFVSHYHTDHSNGIVSMMKDKRIKTLILPDRMLSDDERVLADTLIKTALKNKVTVLFATEGDSFATDKNSTLTILSPQKEIRTDANNASMVIKFTCNRTNILFAGDISEVSQYNIMTNYDIRADIVKVPHHGGYSKMSEKFAKATGCDYAVISCGVDNKYSHPAQNTLSAYSDAKILRTDKNKTIKFIIYKDHVEHFAYLD